MKQKLLRPNRLDFARLWSTSLLMLFFGLVACNKPADQTSKADGTDSAGVASANQSQQGDGNANATQAKVAVPFTEGYVTYRMEIAELDPATNLPAKGGQTLKNEQKFVVKGKRLRMTQREEAVSFSLLADYGNHKYHYVFEGTDGKENYLAEVPEELIQAQEQQFLGGLRLGAVVLDTASAPMTIAGQRCIRFTAPAISPTGEKFQLIGYTAPNVEIAAPWSYFMRAGGLPAQIPGAVFQFGVYKNNVALTKATVTEFKPGNVPDSQFAVPQGYTPLSLQDLMQMGIL